MEALKSLYQEMGDWLSHPFKRDMPISQLLLIFVIFVIVALIVYDGVRILKSWMEAAAETVVDTVT